MQLKGLRILVTGGAGLIGSWIVDKLINEYEANVVIVDNLERATHVAGKPDWVNPRAEFIEGDLSNVEAVQLALCGDVVPGVTAEDFFQAEPVAMARAAAAGPGPRPVDAIFHLAAAGGFSDSYSK
jgi:dTDP-L-rhamnose 4-epimerase